MIRQLVKAIPGATSCYEWALQFLRDWRYEHPPAIRDSWRKPTLRELAARYGCDKLYSHSYIDFYEKELQGRKVKRLLEIGIGYEELMKPFVPFYRHGASLKMWEQFFPEASIFACDIGSDILVNEGRICSVVCDQSKWLSVVGMANLFTDHGRKPFDVIIDDGSHQIEHQVLTAQCLVPYLAKEGLYVIEDVNEPERLLDALGHDWEIIQGKRDGDCLVALRWGLIYPLTAQSHLSYKEP